MSAVWDLYDSARDRALNYAGWFGAGKGTVRAALVDLEAGDINSAIACLHKYLDDAEAAFPPAKLERAA